MINDRQHRPKLHRILNKARKNGELPPYVKHKRAKIKKQIMKTFNKRNSRGKK